MFLNLVEFMGHYHVVIASHKKKSMSYLPNKGKRGIHNASRISY